MTKKQIIKYYSNEVISIVENGLYKSEKIIISPQGSNITVDDGKKMINMCANNYLGLANSPELISEAVESYKRSGFGCSSVRFICGTFDGHKKLEESISNFLKTEE